MTKKEYEIVRVKLFSIEKNLSKNVGFDSFCSDYLLDLMNRCCIHLGHSEGYLLTMHYCKYCFEVLKEL